MTMLVALLSIKWGNRLLWIWILYELSGNIMRMTFEKLACHDSSEYKWTGILVHYCFVEYQLIPTKIGAHI